MATLILTAVGTAVGGPIGGMIGSVVGQYVDQTILFAPKPRHGPRLGDLAVQTSTYGTTIPKLFGRMRVAGCVIWATDLVETRSTSGGGKGQPRLTSYSYSASFAVALSARPIRSVGRVWADGKLLRGVAGDFKTQTGFRLYSGEEDQGVDPLIASAEGEEAPAFRGIAYALFENLQLEDFGNRIPSLTFEVEADPGPVSLGGIAAELSEGAIVAAATPSLIGYAAAGDSIRAAVQSLADVVPLSLADRGDALQLTVAAPAPPVALTADEECGRREVVRRASASIPDEVSLAYYDPMRDFQTGLQRATSFAAGGTRSADRRALAAAISADGAKLLAENRLASLRAARLSARLKLGWRRLGVRPGDVVAIPGEPGTWKVRRWNLTGTGLELELVRTGTALGDPIGASPGRAVGEADFPHGATLLRFHDLPLGEPRAGRPLLFAAAAGTAPGWRRASLISSFDRGASWQDAGQTATPAVLGTAIGALAPGASTIRDDRSILEIELQHDGMWLEHAADAALADGANLALVGDELVQFGRADWIGGRRFALSRLLRGRRGSEWAAALHAAGEPFLLIEADALVPLEAPAGAIGAEARLSASGVGDLDGPALAALTVSGESLRPPTPVHLRARRLANGDIAFTWVRRSRHGWAWPNGTGTPLGEETEAYRLALSGSGFARTATVAEPGYLYSAASQAIDGTSGAIRIEVVQVGTHGLSRPASTNFE